VIIGHSPLFVLGCAGYWLAPAPLFWLTAQGIAAVSPATSTPTARTVLIVFRDIHSLLSAIRRSPTGRIDVGDNAGDYSLAKAAGRIKKARLFFDGQSAAERVAFKDMFTRHKLLASLLATAGGFTIVMQLTPNVAAQSSGARPAFEVASIKPNTSGEPGARSGTRPGGRYIAMNTSLKGMVMQAYGLQSFQITGGPGWLETDRYDVNAKGEENIPERQIWLMLQSLLADRFKLKVHREMKESGIYSLVVAKSGLRLQPSSATGVNFGVGGRKIVAQGASMDDLTNLLTIQLGQPVSNKTGVTGRFDITLSWAPDAATAGSEGAPSIFTVIQEQLGLRLESGRGPVEILVIDSAEKPTPDGH
jgi:uncharacterized protein (TIGR03435 family)